MSHHNNTIEDTDLTDKIRELIDNIGVDSQQAVLEPTDQPDIKYDEPQPDIKQDEPQPGLETDGNKIEQAIKDNTIKTITIDDKARERLTQVKEAGEKLASKAVLCLLAAMAPKLRIKPPQTSGYLNLSFKEIPETLCIALGIVDKDYRTQIDIIPGYEKDLYLKYQILKQVAVAYWKEFSMVNTRLMKKLKKALPNIDFSELRVDPNNPTTMYFDVDYPIRISIACIYLDKFGKPMMKST